MKTELVYKGCLTILEFFLAIHPISRVKLHRERGYFMKHECTGFYTNLADEVTACLRGIKEVIRKIANGVIQVDR